MFGLDIGQNQIVYNRSHPLNIGRVAWWLASPSKPGCYGGQTWIDLVSGLPGTLTGFSSTAGWSPQSYPGGSGSLNFNGGATPSNVTVSNITLPNTATGGATSCTFWGRCVNTTSQLHLLGSSLGISHFGLRFEPGTPDLNVFYNTKTFTFSGGILTAALMRAWTHWGFTIYPDAGNPANSVAIDLYINGTFFGTQAPNTGGAGSDVFSYIGRRSDTAIPFQGWCNDVSLYSRRLPASQFWSTYTLSGQGYPGVLRRRRRVAVNTATAPTVLPWGWDETETTPWRRQLREPIQVIPR